MLGHQVNAPLFLPNLHLSFGEDGKAALVVREFDLPILVGL